MRHDPHCPACKGKGERDSGGVHPWGQPIMVPCDCYECEDCIGMKEYGCFCMANGADRPGGAFDDMNAEEDAARMTDEFDAKADLPKIIGYAKTGPVK